MGYACLLEYSRVSLFRGWGLNTGQNNSKSQKRDWQTVAAAAPLNTGGKYCISMGKKMGL